MSPTQAPGLCPTPGCSSVVYRRGPCKPCRKRRQKRFGTAAQRGYGSRWQRFRLQILARDPFCKLRVKCDGDPSEHVDHKVPINRGGEQYDPANCQGVCAPCHSWKTATQDGGLGR